jgi:magnesium chelatase family protein
MHTTVFSGSILGVEGLTVEVEVDIARGLPCFSIVGLPNTAVRESRERVTAAIKNTELEFPLERITVNLAPADIKKEGAAFDLAIALGIVLTTARRDAGLGSLPPDWRSTLFLGELTLGGRIRWVRGVLPILLHARESGFKRAIVPYDNFAESLTVSGIEVYACRSLGDVLALVAEDASDDLGEAILRRFLGENRVANGGGDGVLHKPAAGFPEGDRRQPTSPDPADRFGDMVDVLGQESVKRALLVAAAGGHHVLMVGPPGAGKTMLARRFCSILPALDDHTALETTMIYSTAGLLNGAGLVTRPPLRSPHHSASDAGLIGGGAIPRPGEVTLAHNGVLFLDELPEFKRHVLETLREPIEEGRITISRARTAVSFPARFQLIAAMNPCPCGNANHNGHDCRCTRPQIDRYVGKISGPLLDRISIHVSVRPVELCSFTGTAGDSSADMKIEIVGARRVQRDRNGTARGAPGNGMYSRPPYVLNARLSEKQVKLHCRLDGEGEALLVKAHKQLGISARGRGHVLRVARTIADLESVENIQAPHLAEAIQYRIRELPV